MRLSNKSTFSLASLILMLALGLGLVFGTSSVMAHPHIDNPATPGIDESVTDHLESDHPKATKIVFTSANATSFTSKSVNAAGTFAIMLNAADVDHDNDSNTADIVKGGRFAETRATDLTVTPKIVQDATGLLKLSITFNTAIDASTFSAGDVKITAVDEDDVVLFADVSTGSNNWTLSAASPSTGTSKAFTLEVAVPSASYTDMPITLYVSVPADDNNNNTSWDGVTSVQKIRNGNIIPSGLANRGSDPGDAKLGMVATLSAGDNPTSPSNIFKFTAPAGFSILVRDKAAASTTIGQSFHTIKDINGNRVIPDANIIEWASMPDLAALFDRNAAGGGGALVLRKSVGDTAAPDIGTVGISEVMWAIDAGYTGQVRARSSQWIEIHNLHATDKDVVIYATTGAEFTDSNRVVTTTLAGDTLHGDPAGQIVDVMTNYFKGNDRGTPGWDVPGSNGSSTTGIDFVSMARKAKRNNEFHLDRRHEDKSDKPYDGRYVKTTGQDQSLDGRAPGSWVASTTNYDRLPTDKPASLTTPVPATYDLIGTPGRSNAYSVAGHILKDAQTKIPASPIVINEVANRPDTYNKYEWIELRNVSADEVNLNNYQISILTKVDSDKPFIYLSNNNNAKIPAGGVLVLTDSDPYGDSDHPLATGWDVDKNAEDQVPGLARIGINATSLHGRYKVVKFGEHTDYAMGLPDDGNFILVVRRADNHEGNHGDGGKGRAELGTADLDKINDIAGHVDGDDLKKTNYSNAVSSTNLWPLKAQGHPASAKNKFVVNTVQRRQHLIQNGQAGAGTTHGDKKDGQVAFIDHAYTGIGYKRQAADHAMHGGDPGYHGITKNDAHGTAGPRVYISEIMLSQGNGRNANLPQYIELYNASDHAVNLAGGEGVGWRIVIENPKEPLRTINFRSKGNVKIINPKQTVLVVSGSARSFGSDTLPASTVFPNTRVFNVYKELRSHFEMTNRASRMLNPEAFNIKLIDGGKKVDNVVTYTTSDEIGNLDGNVRTSDEGKWKYPIGITKDGFRSSLIRVFDNNVARPALSIDESDVLPLGAKKMDETVDLAKRSIPEGYAWVRASQADFGGFFVRHTWYGNESDFGTPANRAGQILPVNLSHFRPALEDGEVVIRWTTESELDNAGFNILRSDTRTGEYKQVNAELIQGHGTTGERSTYKWVDASAKPGVVYYYQIEDVSFAGERQTLQTTKLKGYISAVGKATTTWGDIKEVQ